MTPKKVVVFHSIKGVTTMQNDIRVKQRKEDEWK